jgi:hypothetical protein
MSTKAQITSDFPTPSEVASRLRIPASRAAELRRQMIDLHGKFPDGSYIVIETKDGLRARRLTGRRAKKK